jgi:hypothetical protein
MLFVHISQTGARYLEIIEKDQIMKFSAQRYIIVFIITAGIFGLVFWASGIVGDRKVQQLQMMQQQIGLDILSTETRYALLGATSCEYTVQNEDFERGLNQELNELARRVKFLESELGEGNDTVLRVKEQYNLLQIKDYLLRRDINNRCGDQIVSILYFHEADCRACQKQSLVLDELHAKYPEVRTYWLDRDLVSPAMETLTAMFDIEKSPTLIVEDNTIEDFSDLATLEEYLPQWLIDEKEAELEALEEEKNKDKNDEKEDDEEADIESSEE